MNDTDQKLDGSILARTNKLPLSLYGHLSTLIILFLLSIKHVSMFHSFSFFFCLLLAESCLYLLLSSDVTYLVNCLAYTIADNRERNFHYYLFKGQGLQLVLSDKWSKTQRY